MWRLLIVILCGAGLAACDVVVEPGRDVRLVNGARIRGAPGTAERPGGPAVTVRPGATLRVEDATVVGGSDRVSKPPLILTEGTELPDLDLELELSTVFLVSQVTAGEGISSTEARVLLSGGLVQGGDAESSLKGPGSRARAGSGVDLLGGQLLVAGGRVRGGRTIDASPLARPGGVTATRARVEIRDGLVEGLELMESTALIRGGQVNGLLLSPSFRALPSPGFQSCVEIRGGLVSGTLFLSDASVVVVGGGFNLPFGDIVIPASGLEPFPLSGVLADGSPFAVVVHPFGEGSLRLFDARFAPTVAFERDRATDPPLCPTRP